MGFVFPAEGLSFLSDLAIHNRKVWFVANKKRCERDLKQPAHKTLNRINRDIRFRKDRTPYNTPVWGAWMPTDVPKGAGVGCGVWAPDKDRMSSLRAYWSNKVFAWKALVGVDATIGGKEVYKRVCKPYPVDYPAAESLKLKGIHFKGDIPTTTVTSPDLVDAVAARFRQLAPIVGYLNRGLGV